MTDEEKLGDRDWTMSMGMRLHEIGIKSREGQPLSDEDGSMISFCAGLLIGIASLAERQRFQMEEAIRRLREIQG